MSDVWTGPDAADAARNLDLQSGAVGTDDPLDVARSVWGDFKNHIMGYVMAGISYLVAVLALVFFAMSALLLGVPGAVLENDALLIGGMVAGFSIYTILIVVFSFFVFPLLNASLIRTLDMQRRGEHQIGFLSLYTHARITPGKIVIFYLMAQTMVLVGMLFLYIPGIIAAIVVTFAMPIVVLQEETSPVEAVQQAFEHMKTNVAWHLGVWLSLFGVLIVSELTLVG